MDPNRAAVAFGRRAVPQLFEQLQQRDAPGRLRALTSLCDLVHEPERLYQTVTGGFLEQLQVLLKDEDPSVRTKTCELLHMLTSHSIGSWLVLYNQQPAEGSTTQQTSIMAPLLNLLAAGKHQLALLSSSLLPPLFSLLDDASSSCRRNVHLVLNGLAQLPAGAQALLPLVPKLMLKLRQMQEEEEEEEEEVLLLSTLSCCSRLDPLPALASHGVLVLGQTLTHCSPDVRREGAAVLMALSVPEDGKRRVCEEQVLPVLMVLLQDEDVEVQTNAAGVIMNTVIITTGKHVSLELKVIPVLLSLLSEEEEEEQRKRRKTLVLYCLRALTSLAEAPEGRTLLQEQLPLLERRSQDQDQDVRRAAQTAFRVVTWRP